MKFFTIFFESANDNIEQNAAPHLSFQQCIHLPSNLNLSGKSTHFKRATTIIIYILSIDFFSFHFSNECTTILYTRSVEMYVNFHMIMPFMCVNKYFSQFQ